MARALPLMTPTIALLALAMGAAAVQGCTSDDLIDATSTSTTAPDMTTEIQLFTTGEVDETTTTGPPPDSDTTCREALNCVVNCLIAIPNPTPPEYEFGCFLDCEGDLSTVEWLRLIDFAECLNNYCTNTAMQCPDVSEDDPTCQMCLLVGLGDLPPAECMLEAKECQ